MAINNAFVLVASHEITSTTASVNLSNCMSSTYDTYYFVATNVKVDTNQVTVRVIPKVSDTAKTGTFTNEASRYSNMAGGSMGNRDNGTYATRDYIMQIPYVENVTTGANAFIEGWIMNSQSSSHNTYSASSVLTSQETTSYGYRYLQNNEDDSTDVYDGLYIVASSGNIEAGKFQLFGLRTS